MVDAAKLRSARLLDAPLRPCQQSERAAMEVRQSVEVAQLYTPGPTWTPGPGQVR